MPLALGEWGGWGARPLGIRALGGGPVERMSACFALLLFSLPRGGGGVVLLAGWLAGCSSSCLHPCRSFFLSMVSSDEQCATRTIWQKAPSLGT